MPLLEDLDRDFVHGHARDLHRLGPQVGKPLQRGLGSPGDDLVLGAHPAVLDGGLGVWTAEGRPLSTEPVDRPAKQLTPAPRPELIADRDEVFAAIDKDAVSIIDALPEASYRGEMTMYDRPGHINGASNTPSTSLLDESGRYRSHDELAAMHDGDRNGRVITYCGGGIAASSNAFVMTRLGFTDVAVYTASLQEWAADPANPMEVDTP